MAAPDLEQEKIDFIEEKEKKINEPVAAEVKKQKPKEMAPEQSDDFDLSDITHLKNKSEQSREEIIAAAEAAAFSESNNH